MGKISYNGGDFAVSFIMIRVYVALLSAVFFWGSAFVGISFALKGYSPEALALGRGLIASTLAFFLILKYRCKLALKQRLYALFLGVLGIGIYSLFLNIGEKTVSAGVAGFIVGQMPLIASVLAFFFLKEKMNKRLVVGILISVLGLLFIMLGESGGLSFGRGVLCVGVSALSGALYTCFQKPLLKTVPTIPFICHAIWGGTLFLIGAAFLANISIAQELQNAPSSATAALIYLGCCPSVIAYVGWTYAISKVNIAKAGVLFYAIPVVGGLLAWILLHEVPSQLASIGMVLAFSGALIGTLKIKKKDKKLSTSSQEAALRRG